jgi:hypothetical protein
MLSATYAVATLPTGVKINKSDLLTVGARTRELDSLVDIVNQWIDQNSPFQSVAGGCQSDQTKDVQMTFPPGLTEGRKWPFAVYKPQKKTGKATWESSYDRFVRGESPEAIAMSPENGRPIQISTIISHVQYAFLLGKPVDLHRLSHLPSKPPDKREWVLLEQAEEATGIDVAGDPSSCCPCGSKFTMAEFLRPIMGDDFIDCPREERTDYDQQKFGEWCNLLKWYLFLRRAGIKPKFGDT